MIKALAEKDGRKLLILILFEENLEKLKDEQPILITVEQMKISKIIIDEIFICYFETFDIAVKYLMEHKLLDGADIKYE